MVHRSEFLRDFRLQVTTEFHRYGQDAQWASGSGPRFWGDEDDAIKLDTSGTPEIGRTRSAMAMSSDGCLLAIASSSTIMILDVGTKKVLDELKGHPNSVEKLVFAPVRVEGGRKDGSCCYMLLSVDDGCGKAVVGDQGIVNM